MFSFPWRWARARGSLFLMRSAGECAMRRAFILLSEEEGWYTTSKGTRTVGTNRERREAWSAGSGAFCVLAGLNAPRYARSQALCRVERRVAPMSATISLLFGLLVAIVVLATLATRLRLPYAILLVLGGLLLGFVPGLPNIALNPELVLVLFLPPLIYSSAWLTSFRAFRANLRPILQLALGLVLMTTPVIAALAPAIAALPWPVAFVLGPVSSPTDAVAARARVWSMTRPGSSSIASPWQRWSPGASNFRRL